MVKPFVGVVHLSPLPSSSRGGATPFEETLAAALRDARAYASGGVDGLIVENFGDAPFHKGTRDDPVPPDVPAALAVAAREVRAATNLPVGINCLRNDAVAALGAAAIAGARWVRINVLAGSAITDQGQIDGEAARVLAFRKQLGADGGRGRGGSGGGGGGGARIEILADLFVKHSVPLAAPTLEVAARDLMERAGADALIVTGARTGAAPDGALLDQVQAALGGAVPLWVGSGLTPDNARELWPRCGGAIVGTWCKQEGRIGRPVDPARVERLRRALA